MISGGAQSKAAMLVAVLLQGFLLCTGVRAQTGPDPLLGFADHLFDSGDYYRAITEYERFLFLYPDSDKVPRAELQIALCYLKGQKPDAARARLRDLQERYAGREDGRRASWMLEESYRSGGDYGQALDQIDSYLVSYPNASNAAAARLTRGICHLREGSPDLAKEAFSSVPPSSPLREAADGLDREADRYGQIHRKSPGTAGALSAVLPGAGQLYVGRPHDAILAFVLNGVLIFAAYEAFDNDENVAGGIVTVLETGWYFGNIYNAVNGAQKFNKREKEQFFRNIDVRYGPVISGAGDPAGVSVGASWSF